MSWEEYYQQKFADQPFLGSITIHLQDERLDDEELLHNPLLDLLKPNELILKKYLRQLQASCNVEVEFSLPKKAWRSQFFIEEELLKLIATIPISSISTTTDRD